jgi:hypothetical protein
LYARSLARNFRSTGRKSRVEASDVTPDAFARLAEEVLETLDVTEAIES